MARAGPLLLFVAAGAAGAGYVVGRMHGDEAAAARAPAVAPAPAPPDWEDALVYGADDPADAEEADAPAPPAAEAREDPVPPSELLDALREHRDSPRAQQILLGMVADAARLGPRMLPEIRRLLEAGEDIPFAAYDPARPGYPTLRVALLAAAEATGDPAAAALIADVVGAAESPVEVVFGAHLLDRLGTLDAAVAQRTLDSLATELTPEQRKAIAAVVREVVPAAARADPVYAERFLAATLLAPEGPRADPGLLAPILDGLPPARAGEIVLSALAAPGDARTKVVLAKRAAQQGDVEVLAGLRRAVETSALDPRVSAQIAAGAMSGSPYARMERDARKALKRGDLRGAQGIAQRYQTLLAEAARTVQAARSAGAPLPRDVGTLGTLYQQRLNMLLAQIGNEFRKAEKKK